MSGPSRLPGNLPMSFGNDSPFPPMHTPRIPSGGFPASPPPPRPAQPPQPLPGGHQMHHRPRPPPLPPSRAEALQREQQIRLQHQQQQQHQQESRPYDLRSPPAGMPASAASQAYSGMPIMASNVAPMQQPVTAMPTSRVLSPRPDARNPTSPLMPPPHQLPFSASYGSPRPMPMPAVPSGTHQQPFSHPQNAAQPNLSSSLDAMHLASGPQASLQPAAGQSRQRHSSEQGGQQSLSGMHRDSVASSSASSESSSLNVQLPDLEELGKRRDQVFAGKDDRRKAAWCKEVFKYIERKLDGNRINDPSLVQYVDQAINFVNRLANAQPPLADALYLRGDLLASGSFPSYHQKDLRAAFSDFELSARMGYAPSWFRIGRDYEVLGDMTRSRDAYERGCSVQDVGCIYRMGMANLLGQLELGIDHGRAIPLLKEAADLSSLDTPQPSYVYGMLLAGEFSHVKVDVHLLVPQPDPSRPHHAATRESEARRRIQRAAYFNFAPAQYRMGWLHEYAQLECAFDPLLSVQYYSLASQGGEVEADLALSKWFLCGAEGCFDKNEALAFTFADKAAAKGLASAEFAMGYFFEVGVGCEKDLNVAKKWYHKASARGSSDAKERLNALAGPEPESLSRKQHEARVDTQLQRKRTEAKMMSDRRARANASEGRQANVSSTLAPTMPAGPTKPNPPSIANAPPPRAPSAPPPSMDLRRKKTMRMVEELAGRGPSQGYRPEIASAPPPPQMPVAASPVQANLQSSSPKRRPAVNQLARPAQPPAESNYPSRLTTPGPPRRGSATPSPMPTPPIRPTMPSTPADTPTSGRSSANKAGIPVQSAPSMGPDKKVYETFGEMGFNSQASREDKDCVIC